MERRLYIGGLPLMFEESDLTELASSYGELEKVEIERDRWTKESRGFGYLTYTQEAGATKALKGLEGYELAGRYLRLKVADGVVEQYEFSMRRRRDDRTMNHRITKI